MTRDLSAFKTPADLTRRISRPAACAFRLHRGEDLVGLINPSGRPMHIAKDEDKKKIPEIGEFCIDLCMPAGGSEEESPHRRSGDARSRNSARSATVSAANAWTIAWRRSSPSRRCARRKNPKYDVILAATVQEEVGCRGAGVAAYTRRARHRASRSTRRSRSIRPACRKTSA